MLLLCYLSGPVAQNTASATVIIIITKFIQRGTCCSPRTAQSQKKTLRWRKCTLSYALQKVDPLVRIWEMYTTTSPSLLFLQVVLEEGQEKEKQKESYRQSRIDEIARLCSTSCDNHESVRLPLQVLYSYWCSLSHPVTGTCWHCKLLRTPYWATVACNNARRTATPFAQRIRRKSRWALTTAMCAT